MDYPFDPEWLDALPEPIADIYRNLELVLLREIADALVDTLRESDLQKIRALRAHNIPLPKIVKAIATATGKSERAVLKLLENAVEENERYYRQAMSIAKLTAPAVLVDQRAIDAIIKQTANEIGNISRSMGFWTGKITPPSKAFNWAVDNAIVQVDSGAFGYDQAIARAARSLADGGLSVVDYPSGHRDKVDVAVRRAVLTGVGQLNQQYTDKSMELLKTDLVQVTAHRGARNIGLGFRNHESWQGKIYRWREYPRTSKGNYPDFVLTCGLGDVQGIKGANCRHSYFPFVEGVNKPTYSQEDLDKLKATKFTYQGKEYDTYTATQQQRKIERTIRKEKCRLAAATNDADKATYKAKIRALYKEYEDFSNAAGLRQQRERANVNISEG